MALVKKTFMVEVEYEEKDEHHVFYDLALEIAVEKLMDGYMGSGSISYWESVTVEEVSQ